ncbi:carbonic anhydrase [Streptomyces sp. NPDC086777]|uniref:carbonic anhydrase n=1 Tax=Streptomyces sp. NPDC086777 TaxID=3154866 RepID=UPI00344CEDFB
MNVVETLTARNADFAAGHFTPGLRLMPSLKTIVIGCVDPRVDPNEVLGAKAGEIATLRNVGGRVTPELLMELMMLRKVTQAFGGDIGPGWEFIVLHHTDCGITRLEEQPEVLSDFFGVDEEELDELHVGDPRAAVTRDVATLRSDNRLAGVRVSGLVYDVTSGTVETVAAP